mmetsp:Transcript_25061/g.50915  ORF Transcript_25061/g.50915 Transcript_25061/m.50915 type:complete len:218 (+) Transcript_25061:129-782(+)
MSGSAVTENVVVEQLKNILKTTSEPTSLIKVVSELYKALPAAKEHIKEELGTTVVDIMRKHPRDFAFSERGSMVRSGEGVTWFTLEEVSKHCTKEDAWIIVDEDVYNITDFVRTHWGWNSAGKNSTIIAIMSALGGDCTRDFMEQHQELAVWPTIKAQLEGFRIGKTLVPKEAKGLRVQYRTWDQLVEDGRIPPAIMPYKDEATRTWISRQYSPEGV